MLEGQDRALKGVQPVGLALSLDGKCLYVAEAGVNAIGVITLDGSHGRLVGHIPTGWWPSTVQVSDVQGVSRSFLDFYRGFGYNLSVSLVLQAILRSFCGS